PAPAARHPWFGPELALRAGSNRRPGRVHVGQRKARVRTRRGACQRARTQGQRRRHHHLRHRPLDAGALSGPPASPPTPAARERAGPRLRIARIRPPFRRDSLPGTGNRCRCPHLRRLPDRRVPMAAQTSTPRPDTWTVIRRLWPEVWNYRGRVGLALLLLVAAKLANVGVPIVMKDMIDALDLAPRPALIPVLLLVAYGALRLSTSLFQDLRQIVFARVLARTSRNITLRVFEHLHSLSLRFHLDRRTGGVARDVERGMSATADLLDWTIYTILPTLLEVTLVCTILIVRFDW